MLGIGAYNVRFSTWTQLTNKFIEPQKIYMYCVNVCFTIDSRLFTYLFIYFVTGQYNIIDYSLELASSAHANRLQLPVLLKLSTLMSLPEL